MFFFYSSLKEGPDCTIEMVLIHRAAGIEPEPVGAAPLFKGDRAALEKNGQLLMKTSKNVDFKENLLKNLILICFMQKMK